MEKNDRIASRTKILLAVFSAVSLACWAAEEVVAFVPVLSGYAEAAAIASLALDVCILGIGLAILMIHSTDRSLPNPLLEILSAAPVIVLSSAPILYAHMEGTLQLLPAMILAARSLRLLRLHRIIPGSNVVLLATLAICESFRAMAGSLIPDAFRYAAALRLLLIPEAMLLLASAVVGSAAKWKERSSKRAERAKDEPQVGQEELIGLLGKKDSW